MKKKQKKQKNARRAKTNWGKSENSQIPRDADGPKRKKTIAISSIIKSRKSKFAIFHWKRIGSDLPIGTIRTNATKKSKIVATSKSTLYVELCKVYTGKGQGITGTGSIIEFHCYR